MYFGKSETVQALAGIKGGWLGKEFANMAPKKNQRKPEELADPYTAVLAQKSTYMGNYETLESTRTMKSSENAVWAVKTWSCYLNGRVLWSAVVVQARARWQQ